jgi:hypothetical protein
MTSRINDVTCLHKYEPFSMYWITQLYCEVLISVRLEQQECYNPYVLRNWRFFTVIRACDRVRVVHFMGGWKISIVNVVRLSVCPSVCLYVCLSFSQSVSLSVVCLYVCLSVCLSVSLSVCLSVCQYVSLCVCLPVRMSVCLSVCQSVCLSLCQSACLSVSQSVSQSVCLSVNLSVCLSVSLSISQSVSLSVSLSVSVSVCLSVCLSVLSCTKNKRSSLLRTSHIVLRTQTYKHTVLYLKYNRPSVQTQLIFSHSKQTHAADWTVHHWTDTVFNYR